MEVLLNVFKIIRMYNSQSMILLFDFPLCFFIIYLTFMHQSHTDCGYKFTRYYYIIHMWYLCFYKDLLHFTCLHCNYMHFFLIFHALSFTFSKFLPLTWTNMVILGIWNSFVFKFDLHCKNFFFKIFNPKFFKKKQFYLISFILQLNFFLPLEAFYIRLKPIIKPGACLIVPMNWMKSKREGVSRLCLLHSPVLTM